MTDYQIDQWLELQIDRLDARYLTSCMTDAEYERCLRVLDQAADHARTRGLAA